MLEHSINKVSFTKEPSHSAALYSTSYLTAAKGECKKYEKRNFSKNFSSKALLCVDFDDVFLCVRLRYCQVMQWKKESHSSARMRTKKGLFMETVEWKEKNPRSIFDKMKAAAAV